MPADLLECYARGDLADPQSLSASIAGLDALMFISPSVEQETELGLAALEVARQAAVPKLVFMATMHPELMAAVPHFRNKIPIKQAVIAGWDKHVILQPNYFFQNDFMVLEAMAHGGVFPLPLGEAGVDAIDVADIAAIAAIALTTDRLDGTVVPISGHDRLTGPSIARTYAELMGRPVVYGGDDITQFGGLLQQIMPGASPWMIADISAMFGEFQRIGGHAAPGDAAVLEALLGRPLRRYSDFAATIVSR